MKIAKDDIPYNLQVMVKLVGMENFLELCKIYGGTMVYIPVYDRVLMGERNREIAKEYNGRNMRELGREYGLTKQQIRRLLEKEGVL